MLRFASLGSGSKGNAILVEAEETTIVVDCGFSLKEFCRRLNLLSKQPEDLSAILVTHEHTDHMQGVARLSRQFNLPVYLTRGTYTAAKDIAFHETCYIKADSKFKIDNISCQPFTVPHDAREPCQFTFQNGNSRLGLLTDTGCITPHIIDVLGGCNALMLECNYEPERLVKGPYPASLKQRVSGHWGHLSNQQSKEFLKKLDTSQLQYLIGMHLSEKNNHPDLALKTMQEGFECRDGQISVACQKQGFSWVELD